MFDCILVNGDSYSAKTSFPTYADYIGTELNVPTINIAVTGSNNDRILRSTLEQVLKLKQQNQNPLVIIGWSFIRRLEVWYYGSKPSVINKIPDKDNKLEHQIPKFVTLDVLLSENEATIEQKCLIQEDLFVHKQLTDFYTKLYLFAHTLNALNVKWFMFSAAKNVEVPLNCFPYIESLEQVKWCQQQSNIYKLHDFCIMNWSEENDPDRKPVTGHLSRVGHQLFSKELLSWLRRCKIV